MSKERLTQMPLLWTPSVAQSAMEGKLSRNLRSNGNREICGNCGIKQTCGLRSKARVATHLRGYSFRARTKRSSANICGRYRSRLWRALGESRGRGVSALLLPLRKKRYFKKISMTGTSTSGLMAGSARATSPTAILASIGNSSSTCSRNFTSLPSWRNWA